MLRQTLMLNANLEVGLPELTNMANEAQLGQVLIEMLWTNNLLEALPRCWEDLSFNVFRRLGKTTW
jgi:hypothetical protein